MTTKRVFICTVGTFGFHGWAITEMPDAQKARIGFGAGNLLGEFGREDPVNRRGVDAHLFEQASTQHRHLAAAAGGAATVRASPRLQLETTRLERIAERARTFALQFLAHAD